MQMRRPEVSSRAGGGRRPRDGEGPDQRYRDAETLIADLEDVLAIETARAATRPARRRRSCARCRLAAPPAPAAARAPRRRGSLRRAGAARGRGAIGAVVCSRPRHTEQRHRAPRATGRPHDAGPDVRSRCADGRARLRPLRRRRRAPDADVRRDRRRPRRPWSTETLHGPATRSKPGVGIYVDAAPGVAAQQMDIRTRPRAGRARSTPRARAFPKELPSDGWVKLGDVTDAGRRARIDLQGPSRCASTSSGSRRCPRDPSARSCRRSSCSARAPPDEPSFHAPIGHPGARSWPARWCTVRVALRGWPAPMSTEPAITDGAGYTPRDGFLDEVFAEDGSVAPHAAELVAALARLGPDGLTEAGRRRDAIFLRQGITFELTGEDGPRDRPLTMDLGPRIVPGRGLADHQARAGAAHPRAQRLRRRRLPLARDRPRRASSRGSSSSPARTSRVPCTASARRAACTPTSPAATWSATATARGRCWRTTSASRRASPTSWRTASR